MSFLKRLVPLKADLQLKLDSSGAGGEELLKGSVLLESKDNFKVEGVRLEVRVEETWREYRPRYSSRGPAGSSSVKVTRKLFSQDFSLSQSFDVAKGDSRDFPFEFSVPVFRPTRGTVAYKVKAVANVKGRPDLTKEIEFA